MERNDLVDAHETLNPVLTACFSGFTQIEKDPRCAINSMTSLVGSANQCQQAGVFQGAIRYRFMKPLVVSAWRDAEYSTHDVNWELSSMILDELIDLPSIRIA
jgi:hypothetical protein